jgi:hypothetical protein
MKPLLDKLFRTTFRSELTSDRHLLANNINTVGKLMHLAHCELLLLLFAIFHHACSKYHFSSLLSSLCVLFSRLNATNGRGVM